MLAARVNNWGRWGADDEIGTLNLITPAVVAAGAACIRRGDSFSLAIPLSEDGPQLGFVPGRVNPKRTMLSINAPLGEDEDQVRFNDDAVEMGIQAATHWDALAHVSYDGRIYNGFEATSVTEAGASKCGIDKVRVLAGRSILLDVARAKGVDRLDGGYAVTGADLDAAAAYGRVHVRPGDIVLVRTGQMQLLHRGDKLSYTYPSPGLSMQSVEWFRDNDIAAVATDTMTFEVYPGEREDLALPVHMLHLVDMGLTQGQNFDMETLAGDCADDGVYEFFLDATPLPFVGGLGGPVNPTAVK